MSFYGCNTKYGRIQDFPERFSANDLRKFRIFTRDHWRCRICNHSAEIAAYRLEPLSVNARFACDAWFLLWRERYSIDWFMQHVLEHDINRAASCERHQNRFDISGNISEVESMLTEIRRIEKHLQACKLPSLFDHGDHATGPRQRRTA